MPRLRISMAKIRQILQLTHKFACSQRGGPLLRAVAASGEQGAGTGAGGGPGVAVAELHDRLYPRGAEAKKRSELNQPDFESLRHKSRTC